jgi:hypothetical protein
MIGKIASPLSKMLKATITKVVTWDRRNLPLNQDNPPVYQGTF